MVMPQNCHRREDTESKKDRGQNGGEGATDTCGERFSRA